MMNDFFHGLPLPEIPPGNMVWLVLAAFPVLSIGAMVGRLAWLLVGDWIAARERRTRLAAEAAELTRYAGEVAVAARRAAATAERHREHWRAASAGVQRSGAALDAAEAKVRRLAGAAAIPVPPLARTPAEYADRERYLHQAAMAACTHGQLSIYQLSDALAHRRGWDPRLHPACQEVVLGRAVRDHLAATHATAVDQERAAWQALQAAAVAADSLDREAAGAASRAELLRPWLEPAPEPTAEVTQGLPQERPALGWQPAPAG
jgi:hypothetical protein